MNVKAIVLREFGSPLDVLTLEESTLPDPGAGEVLVQMLKAPINPADINVIEGKYGIRPSLPYTPGSEGVGLVRVLGADVKGLEEGDHVLLPHGSSTWRTGCLANASRLVRVPKTIPTEQAAMLWINPATAWRMLHDFVRLEKGDWFIQNAANSGVGMAAIQIARELGLRSVNVVRRPELVENLLAHGADVVLVDGPDLRAQVKESTANAEIRLGLNAVGGDSASRLTKCLATHGTLVTYGAMSRQPLTIANAALIFKDIRFRGIWITKWYENADKTEIDSMFQEILPMAEKGLLEAPVDAEYLLEEWPQAIDHATQSARNGKVLFRM